MSEGPKRRQERFQVNFSVRFGMAREFVQEYAENLSTGGLFVRGAHRLTEGEHIVIELDLPGFDTFIVTAKVAHLISPAEAADSNRKPGAGLSIIATPEGFDDAMRAYLVRLGERHGRLVFVGSDEIRQLVSMAGYQVRPLPAPNALGPALETASATVVAVLVTRSLYGHYATVADKLGVSNLVQTIDYADEFDDILRLLDLRIEHDNG